MSLKTKIIAAILFSTAFSFIPEPSVIAADFEECLEGGKPEDCEKEYGKWGKVELLQPLGGGSSTLTVSTGDPIGTFLTYFERSFQWIVTVAVGVVTLWVLISGGYLVLAGGNAAKRSQAISWITSTILGLVILVFFGAILRFLNSSFFVS